MVLNIMSRIKDLKTELAHSFYLDGWVLRGMQLELKNLEKLKS